MTITTKYGIGDEFWYYTHDAATRVTIIKAVVVKIGSTVREVEDKEEITTTYKLSSETEFTEDLVGKKFYQTKEEVILELLDAKTLEYDKCGLPSEKENEL